MTKRVFIVHCWDGHPEYVWYPWLKSELEKRGFDVFVPAMILMYLSAIIKILPIFSNQK